MAQLNYSFYFADGGDNGSGPYTLVVRKNPTAPSGGTLLVTESNTQGNINIPELSAIGQGWISDNIAAANTSDTLNSTA